MRRTMAAAAALFVGSTGSAAGQQQDVRVELSGRLQVQYNTTSVTEADLGGEEGVAGSTFETRRVRFAVEVTVRDWITAMIEPEYALGELDLANVFIDLGIDDAFALRFGQFKKPFSAIFLTSDLEVMTIERGLRIRGIEAAHEWSDAGAGVWAGFAGEEQALLDALGYMDYELGAVAHGRLGSVGYEVGVFNGTGQDARDTNDAKSFAGRLTAGVPDVPLVLGGGFSYRETGIGDASVGGTAFAVDAEWGGFRRPGLNVLVEASLGDNFEADETFRGAQAMIGWFAPVRGARVEGVEAVGRVSWGDPNDAVAGDAGTLLTPGLNVYFFGRNRLSVNWDVFIPEGDAFDTEHGLRAQAQFAF